MASGSNGISADGHMSSDVKFEGFLEKPARLIGALMGKKYWCVLDESRLSYYKNAGKCQCSGYIDVSRVQSVLKTSKVNSFNVLTTSGTHTFVAVSSEARDHWVKAIQDAMTVAGRRLDKQRHSVVSCVMYEDNSDDEAGKLASSPGFDSVFEEDEKRSTLCDERKDSSNVEEEMTATTSGDDVVERGDEAKFTYMNAADLAEARHRDELDVIRVCSVHSDHQEPHPDHNNPSPSSPPSDEALPAQEPLHGSTSDVTPGSSSPTRRPDASVGNERALSTSPDSSPERPSDVRKDGGENGSERGGVESVCQVTMRRPSRPLVTPQQPEDSITSTTLVELHIDTDLKPTSATDFQLDELSTESGSGVQALRQFIENDSCFGRCSTETLPTAIQPGKAFVSLKYFLSTLD